MAISPSVETIGEELADESFLSVVGQLTPLDRLDGDRDPLLQT